MHARWFPIALAVSFLAIQGCSGAPDDGSIGSDGTTSGAGGGNGAGAKTGGSTAGSGSGSGSNADAGSQGNGGNSGGDDTTSDGGAQSSDGSASTDSGHDAGPITLASCGCNGQPGCAQWDDVFITWYGFNDNSCTVESQHNCNDIAYPGLGPKKHAGAMEGTGTYDDPITAAASDQGFETAGGATLQPGTIIYNPEVKKYFIMEDSCLECGDEWKCKLSPDDTDDPNPPASCQPGKNFHIDFWMGPSFQQDATPLNDCEDNSTISDTYKGTGSVLINPPPNLPVVKTPLYTGTGTGGGCWTSSQVDSDVCK